MSLYWDTKHPDKPKLTRKSWQVVAGYVQNVPYLGIAIAYNSTWPNLTWTTWLNQKLLLYMITRKCFSKKKKKEVMADGGYVYYIGSGVQNVLHLGIAIAYNSPKANLRWTTWLNQKLLLYMILLGCLTSKCAIFYVCKDTLFWWCGHIFWLIWLRYCLIQ